MNKIQLARKEYRDKVYACWLGKNIGGTLGTPYEGKKYVHNLTFYDPVPQEPLPKDDLDFQLVWLKMIEDKGSQPTFSDFAEYWMKHLSEHWYNEYSFCTYNLQRGLKPPISGAFQNYFIDEMGSPIRSEIWACLAPANPQLAAQMAWMDASMDHTGGEGRWGEMFWAAAESAAFVIKELRTIIQIGLSMIPISSNISRVIREALRCYQTGMKWDEARERIATIFGHHQPCNAIPNHGFTIIGLLYGKDYGDKLCKAVNCAYDTDCTGATFGSLLGIMHGTSIIPEEWRKPIGDGIKPCKFTMMEGLPRTLRELTECSEKAAQDFTRRRSDTTEFAEKASLPKDLLSLLFRNEKVQDLLTFDIHSAVENAGDFEIIFHYGGEPVLYPGIEKRFEVSVRKDGRIVEPAGIEVKGSTAWEISRPVFTNGRYGFDVFAENIKSRNNTELTLRLENKTYGVTFAILNPEEIRIIPAAVNAPKE